MSKVFFKGMNDFKEISYEPVLKLEKSRHKNIAILNKLCIKSSIFFDISPGIPYLTCCTAPVILLEHKHCRDGLARTGQRQGELPTTVAPRAANRPVRAKARLQIPLVTLRDT
jgi:hypothetical protein